MDAGGTEAEHADCDSDDERGARLVAQRTRLALRMPGMSNALLMPSPEAAARMPVVGYPVCGPVSERSWPVPPRPRNEEDDDDTPEHAEPLTDTHKHIAALRDTSWPARTTHVHTVSRQRLPHTPSHLTPQSHLTTPPHPPPLHHHSHHPPHRSLHIKVQTLALG